MNALNLKQMIARQLQLVCVPTCQERSIVHVELDMEETGGIALVCFLILLRRIVVLLTNVLN